MGEREKGRGGEVEGRRRGEEEKGGGRGGGENGGGGVVGLMYISIVA